MTAVVSPPATRPAGRPALAMSLVPAAAAAALALIAVALRWRGSDLPAQLFRIGIVEREGLQIWNNQWFGGHHLMGYGLALPLLGALVGVWTVAIGSAAVSSFLVDRLIIAATGRRRFWASMWFAAGTLTNVAVGRLTFALGLTIGIAALLAATHRRLLPAALCAVLTATASPVASAFLVVVVVAWAVVARGERRFFATLTAASAAPLAAIAVLFPQGGTFPFEWAPMLWTLFVCAAVGVLIPAQQRLVRMCAAMYGAAVVLAFIVPNPLGSNIVRLGMYAAGPVLLAVVPWRRGVTLLVPFLLWWQWSPAFDAVVRAGRDPSTHEAYYAELESFLRSVGAETERVEVVPTKRHWETVYVADDIPIARGWERQLDRRFNPLFYEPGLTPEAYSAWLLDNGVRYVAMGDAPLDYAGLEEAAVLQTDPAFLRLVFDDDHWRVWEVVDSPGLIEGPAELLAVGTESFQLRVLERGDVVVRFHESAYWASAPNVCIESTPDGWILLRDAPPGDLEVFIDAIAPLRRNDPCDVDGGT